MDTGSQPIGANKRSGILTIKFRVDLDLRMAWLWEGVKESRALRVSARSTSSLIAPAIVLRLREAVKD